MGRYRPNVAALMVNEEGLLLVCERLGISGAWQFPQGGIDEGESAEEAIVREIEEEIGLSPEDYLLEKSKGGYRYDYPPEVREKMSSRKSQFVGQEQIYFRCRVKADAGEIDLTQEPREFSQAKWIKPEGFRLEWLPDFKREIYREVLRDFFDVECIAAHAIHTSTVMLSRLEDNETGGDSQSD